jgi:hypothetical protein
METPRRIGITGSRYVTPVHHPLIDEVLFKYLGVEEWTTGGAVGVDTYVLRRMVPLQPDAMHRVLLPEYGPGWDNFYLEQYATEVIKVPNTMNHPERSRNVAIIERSDLMLAFPLHPEDHGQSKRSGTWMTIREARKRNVPIEITVLEP